LKQVFGQEFVTC